MSRIFVFCVLSVLFISCGGSPDELGTVAGEPITVDEFLAAFSGLSPDRQVAVLEPGGRMALVTSIATKRLLLAECNASPAADSDFWVELYSSAWLSDSLTRSMAMDFDPQPVLAGLDSSVYAVHLVLLADSNAALETANSWRESGPADPGGSMIAPWSAGSGSSFRLMASPPWHFPANLVPLLSSTDVQVLPLYGGWLVGVSQKTDAEVVPDQNAGMSLFGWEIDRITDTSIDARAVNTFAAGYPTDYDGSVVLASWSGGTLTADMMARILEQVSPSSFPDSIPPELSAFTRFNAQGDPATSMWFVVMSTSRTLAMADIALEQGAVVPEAVVDFAGTEALIRERVIRPALPDSAEVLAFYETEKDFYALPERRSVLLVYVASERVPGLQGATSFSDLGEYQSMTDSSGNLVPDPASAFRSIRTGSRRNGVFFGAGHFPGPGRNGRRACSLFPGARGGAARNHSRSTPSSGWWNATFSGAASAARSLHSLTA